MKKRSGWPYNDPMIILLEGVGHSRLRERKKGKHVTKILILLAVLLYLLFDFFDESSIGLIRIDPVVCNKCAAVVSLPGKSSGTIGSTKPDGDTGVKKYYSICFYNYNKHIRLDKTGYEPIYYLFPSGPKSKLLQHERREWWSEFTSNSKKCTYKFS